MDNSSEITGEPANLTLLRRLVTTLLIVMILGFLTLISLFVIRFSPQTENTTLSEISLPDGVSASAYTKGPDWYAIVTKDNKIMIFNQSDQSLRQTIDILPQ